MAGFLTEKDIEKIEEDERYNEEYEIYLMERDQERSEK